MGVASGDVKLQVKRSEDRYRIITYPGKADKPHWRQELYYWQVVADIYYVQTKAGGNRSFLEDCGPEYYTVSLPSRMFPNGYSLRCLYSLCNRNKEERPERKLNSVLLLC